MGITHSKETRKKISAIKKGTKCTEEAKKKHSKAALGNKYRLGIKHSEEQRKKISEAVTKHWKLRRLRKSNKN